MPISMMSPHLPYSPVLHNDSLGRPVFDGLLSLNQPNPTPIARERLRRV
jgi:hypothetical protein